MDANLNIQLTIKHTKQSASSHLQTDNQIQVHSKSAHKQSVLSQSKTTKLVKLHKFRSHSLSKHNSTNEDEPQTRDKRFQTRFYPVGSQNNRITGRKKPTTRWQGSPDREESLKFPRWHKRSPTEGKKGNTNRAKSPDQKSPNASTALD